MSLKKKKIRKKLLFELRRRLVVTQEKCHFVEKNMG